MDPKSIKKYKYVGNTISEDDITFEEHKHNNEKLTAVSNNGNFGNIGNVGNVGNFINWKRKHFYL